MYLHGRANLYSYAYLEFADPASVEVALALNDSQLHNRPIKVCMRPI